MAVTNFSPLLGLALPTTGDLSGTWGSTINDSITALLDSAVAGTTTLSADADVTLSITNGVANQARSAVLRWTAGGTTTRNITAPAQSKAYIVINDTSGTQSIVLRGDGPTTGITVVAGEKCIAVWDGSDFVKLSSLISGAVGVVNGGTGATTLTGILKGSGTSPITAVTAPTGELVGTTDTQTLSGKTVTDLVFDGSYTEQIHTLATSGTIALVPANGTIQTCASSGAVTFTDSLSAGQTLVLMITDGETNTVTWPTITWVTGSGNNAPALTAADTFVFWKVSTTLYGAYVGSYV